MLPSNNGHEPSLKIIAHIQTDFDEKFGIPRQSGLIDSTIGRIVLEDEYRSYDAVRGLSQYKYLWLLWKFEDIEDTAFRATVRPPRLGGNTQVGVFATRSPFRPNHIGLSSVKLLSVDESPNGPVIVVAGADLRNNTPIYDIKPYLLYTDCHPDANNGIAESGLSHSLSVEYSNDTLSQIPESMLETITKMLSLDPRPSYQDDPNRECGVTFAGMNINFHVIGTTLHVTKITR